ncbi:MAG: hypothetical protein PVI78_12080 [Anaerolineales bacterium]|jgi:hypothetical protein
MDLSKQEAKQALEAVRHVDQQIRSAIARGGAPYHMILWGAIWFVGYICSHFIRDAIIGWIWVGLVALGSLLSFIIGMRFRSKMRSGSSKRIMVLWLAITVYAAIVWWIADPTRGEQASMLIVAFCMFGYVITGIWIEPTAAWVGVIVTVLAAIGYAFLLPYFALWMAFLAGGTLILSGVYILRRWRYPHRGEKPHD